MAPPIRPLIMEPTEREAMMVTPNMATQKISAGPNSRDMAAKGGEKSSRATMPTRPPTREAAVA